jgi:hypothetical protein
MANSGASCDAFLLAQAHLDCGVWSIADHDDRLSVIALAAVAARWALGAGLFLRSNLCFPVWL